LSAAAMYGNRSVKSLPLRVMSRIPVRSRRARMRKPSCFISWDPAGPEGGVPKGCALSSDAWCVWSGHLYGRPAVCLIGRREAVCEGAEHKRGWMAQTDNLLA
jgi:hypothetical protein